MTSSSTADESGGAEERGELLARVLTVCAPAAAHINGYLRRQDKVGATVRVAVVRTHCMGGQGFGYNIQEGAAGAIDVVEIHEGITFAMDRDSAEHLRGSTIDFEESLQGGGLKVRNPNSLGKCHCGRHDLLEPLPVGASPACH